METGWFWVAVFVDFKFDSAHRFDNMNEAQTFRRGVYHGWTLAHQSLGPIYIAVLPHEDEEMTFFIKSEAELARLSEAIK